MSVVGLVAPGLDALEASLGAAEPSFTSAAAVRLAVAEMGDLLGFAGRAPEGSYASLLVAPGTVRLKFSNACTWVGDESVPMADERRRLAGLRQLVRAGLVTAPDLVNEVKDKGPRRVTEWSRASRNRMHRTIGELDFSEWAQRSGGCTVLAMVTLTLPREWQRVAPNGRAMKRIMEVFRRRWIRQIGPWIGLWKLEFQERGAPHVHYLLRVPAMVGDERFENWLSMTWADICRRAVPVEDRRRWVSSGEYARHLSAGTGVDFSGVKFSDPRRTAIYFGKHSAKSQDNKEYQHVVPSEWRENGPGRFWGHFGLPRAVSGLVLREDEFAVVARALRSVRRGRAASTAIGRLRREYADDDAGFRAAVLAMRRVKVKGLGTSGRRTVGGAVLVNDGVGLARDLTRLLLTDGRHEPGLSGRDPLGLDSERGGA